VKSNPIWRTALFAIIFGLLPSLAWAQSPQPQQPATPAATPTPAPKPPVVLPTTFADIPCPTEEEKKAWKAQWLQHDWNREKYEKKIATDTIVIHHTADPAGITWQRLSEIQYQTLYVPVYNSDSKDPVVKGLTPQSGHYRYNDQGILVQVYYAYHAIVRENGTIEALLLPTEVGWQSGSWQENMKSLGLVFDGDYRAGAGPSDAMLQAAARQILEWKKFLPLKFLKAHKEVNKKTVCPGPWWDTKGADGKTGAEKLAAMTGLQLVAQ